ncbi:Reticulon-domain-containing protein [Bombardia bombarda]|uniref:Reticulon-like protein n=1 Tax=Bombardia bombarda TaxID=252184 RepID=A0AA40CFT7_9PEZI|nr:Reticulon-domain-containing protein [Bombardia bombarda]
MADGAASYANGGNNLDGLKSSKFNDDDLGFFASPPFVASRLTIASSDVSAAYDTVANGPIAQNVVDQSQKTTAELSNLANARQTPATRAATGQPLTHYHSFFSELLSWNNPRASAIAYASVISFIFAVRYLDLLRWGLKLTWMVLGITIAAEIAGKALLNNGFATQLRPRKYYTVPRETLDAMIGDVNELINFFVIETQRILFAENLYVSAAAAIGAFLSYYLVKIVPYWGLGLIASTVLFFAPLIYTTNQELIDEQIRAASNIVNAQTSQLKTVVVKQTEQATEVTKQYMGDYTAKAQALIKGAKAPEHTTGKHTTGKHTEHKSETLKSDVFPVAPKEEFAFPAVPKNEFSSPQAPEKVAVFNAPESAPVYNAEKESLI